MSYKDIILYIVFKENQDNQKSQQDWYSWSGCSERVGLGGEILLFLSLALRFGLQHSYGMGRGAARVLQWKRKKYRAHPKCTCRIKGDLNRSWFLLALGFSDSSQGTLNFSVKKTNPCAWSLVCFLFYKTYIVPYSGNQVYPHRRTVAKISQ